MRTAVTRALGGLVVVATLASGLSACTGDDGSSTPTPEPSSEPTTSPTEPVDLTFGVFGSNEEIQAYTAMANNFDTVDDRADVTVKAWLRHDGLRRSIELGKPVPDVFLVSRRDLRWFVENGLTAPVDTLLDERGVDFGDVYSRDALEAFSSDNRLQCMPYGVAPQVVFYNENMVDFNRMEIRGFDVPADHRRWSWDQFVTAAKFAARPFRETKGVAIDPTLAGLAPFVYSGGGDLFDDDTDPTSLAFSDESTQDALETILTLFRDPKLTLSQEQLEEKSPLEWFEEGKVGMITGTRALVPGAARGAGPPLRRDADPVDRGGGDRRRDQRPLHLAGRREPGHGRRLHGLRLEHRSGERGRARGLPPAGQPGGRALRRLPPARREARSTAPSSTRPSGGW